MHRLDVLQPVLGEVGRGRHPRKVREVVEERVLHVLLLLVVLPVRVLLPPRLEGLVVPLSLAHQPQPLRLALVLLLLGVAVGARGRGGLGGGERVAVYRAEDVVGDLRAASRGRGGTSRPSGSFTTGALGSAMCVVWAAGAFVRR